MNIFIIELSDSDPLWRVRAYVIGFLLADGTLYYYKKKGEYTISAHQHKRDMDILSNIQKAIGGKISGPNKKELFRLRVLSKDLFYKLKELGMKERHSLEDIAIELLPPQFIEKKINQISIVRDFFRGNFEGDGTFYGSYEDSNMKFNIVGSEKFLQKLNSLILKEVNSLSTYITPHLLKVYETENNEFYLFGKNRIYIKGIGYHTLTAKDLENGIIKTKRHSWLKILHIAGSNNCVKFFNWLYCNDDDFDNFKINDIKLCGKRKFQKCLNAIGNSSIRKERLAPYWKDIIYDIITLIEPRYYDIEELMDMTNKHLYSKLKEINLEYLYNNNKIENADIYRWRLRFLEFEDEILGRFRVREGKKWKTFYFSKLNPPPHIPPDFHRNIELIESNGNLKRNVKNLITYSYLKKNNWRSCQQIREELFKYKIFAKSTLRLNVVKLYLLELISFEILIINNNELDFKDQLFLLNNQLLPDFYGMNLETLKDKLELFLK